MRPPPPPSSGSCSSTARFLANPNGRQVEKDEEKLFPEFGGDQTVGSTEFSVARANTKAAQPPSPPETKEKRRWIKA